MNQWLFCGWFEPGGLLFADRLEAVPQKRSFNPSPIVFSLGWFDRWSVEGVGFVVIITIG